LYFGFLLFTPVSEVSATGTCSMGSRLFERPPVSQVACLAEQKASCDEMLAWLVREHKTFMINPHACRFFRPPRDTSLRSKLVS
jgi:hypothetical protein